jgi:diphosphoinositol-polyphosphate diphosphatase
MSSVEARIGRHRQRYENNLRLVSGCIPYRLSKEEKDHSGEKENCIEVLMVSSPNRDDLVFPKGGWEDDENVFEAASREALEEAGVKGTLNENLLGFWEFRSKSKQDICSLKGGCKGYMFALEVTEELETWPEQKNRYRKWLKIEDAFRLCRYEWMRMALKEFVRVMAGDEKLQTMEDLAEPPSTPVPDVVPDCQIMTSSCCAKPSSCQHHGMSAISPYPLGICLSRGCL